MPKFDGFKFADYRIAYRWDAIQAETDAKEKAKLLGERYVAEKISNGDTLKEPFARSRYVLFKLPEKWTEKQKVNDKKFFLYRIGLILG